MNIMKAPLDISKLSDGNLENLISEAADGMTSGLVRIEVALGWVMRYNILSTEREERRYRKLKETNYKRTFTFAPPNY